MLSKKDFIVHTPTKELYDKVMRMFEKEGVTWRDGEKPIELNIWDICKRNTCISFLEEKGWRLRFYPKFWYKKNYPEIPIISAQKFLNHKHIFICERGKKK